MNSRFTCEVSTTYHKINSETKIPKVLSFSHWRSANNFFFLFETPFKNDLISISKSCLYPETNAEKH